MEPRLPANFSSIQRRIRVGIVVAVLGMGCRPAATSPAPTVTAPSRDNRLPATWTLEPTVPATPRPTGSPRPTNQGTPTRTGTPPGTPAAFATIQAAWTAIAATRQVTGTVDLLSTTWTRYDSEQLAFSVEYPEVLALNELGSSVTIASSVETFNELGQVVPLFVRIQVEAADSPRLPPGADPDDPLTMAEGMLAELDKQIAGLTVVEAVTATQFGGNPAATGIVESLGEDEAPGSGVTYLLAAVSVNGRVALFSASVPSRQSGVYLPAARRMADSLVFR